MGIAGGKSVHVTQSEKIPVLMSISWYGFKQKK